MPYNVRLSISATAHFRLQCANPQHDFIASAIPRASVLRGADELVINLKTAKAIGIEVPTPLLVHADEVPNRGIFAAMHFVRFWHKADILIIGANVRFRGNSGHRPDFAECLLLTQSGHGGFAI